jgi:cytochrome c oxidase assembly protein subunit 15
MALGIATLVLAVPLWAGLSHQLLAMIVLAAAVVHARRCFPPRESERQFRSVVPKSL